MPSEAHARIESGAPALNDPDLFRELCYIDGAWVPADSGETIAVNNPASGDVMGTVPKMGADETRRAIEAAERAWPEWRARTAKERAGILRRWHDLMIENQDDLAVMMTMEQGKPLAEAKGEVVYGASFIEWFAEEGQAHLRRHHPAAPAGQAHRRGQAAGRRGGGHHALELPQRHDHPQGGPALAAGCPVVIKPASQTPYSALALAELAERAGMPKRASSTW